MVPVVPKVCVYNFVGSISVLSNVSALPVSLVVVWVSLSLLVNVTAVPLLMLRQLGENEKLTSATLLPVAALLVVQLEYVPVPAPPPEPEPDPEPEPFVEFEVEEPQAARTNKLRTAHLAAIMRHLQGER